MDKYPVTERQTRHKHSCRRSVPQYHGVVTVAANGVAVDVYIARGGRYTSPSSVEIQSWSSTGRLLETWTAFGESEGAGRYPYGIGISELGSPFAEGEPIGGWNCNESRDGAIRRAWPPPQD